MTKTTQTDIENGYSRRMIRTVVLGDIGTDSEVLMDCIEAIHTYRKGKYYDSKNNRIASCNMANNEIALELCVAILVVKEINPIQSVAAQLGNRLGYSNPLDGIKTAAEIIAVCEKTGLFTLYHSTADDNDTGTLGVKPNYKLSDSVEEYIEQTMYLPPMIETPEPWKDNSNGGHLLGSGSVILGSINHHNYQQNLDSLNIIQGIEWELNEDVLEYDELSKKPLDTPEKTRQFNNLVKKSKAVYNSMIKLGNKFYFVWKYDKRGRMYSQGYHINLQSTEYKKAILQFSNKKVII